MGLSLTVIAESQHTLVWDVLSRNLAVNPFPLKRRFSFPLAPFLAAFVVWPSFFSRPIDDLFWEMFKKKTGKAEERNFHFSIPRNLSVNLFQRLANIRTFAKMVHEIALIKIALRLKSVFMTGFPSKNGCVLMSYRQSEIKLRHLLERQRYFTT